jgi:uncharacterized protein (DUF111 family)
VASRSPPAALHLHLDVAAGVRADALVGALLGAGAPRAAMDEAVTALLGPGVRVDVDRRRVLGVQAVSARIVVPGLDDDFSDVQEGEPGARGLERRRRPRAFVRDQRRGRVLAPVAEAEAPPPDAQGAPAAPRASRVRAPREPGLLERFAAGERARPADLAVLLRHSKLAPVTKALALRTTAALVESLGRVRGDVDEPCLDGGFALRSLAHVAAACALVDELGPAVVTSSVIGVTARARGSEGLVDQGRDAPAPSAWLAALLEGAWVLEREEGTPSDVVGAALVRTLASRFGARGVFSPHKHGFGIAHASDAGAPLLVRASTGRAAPIGSRAGEGRSSPGVFVRASVELSVDRASLAHALFQAGALEVSAREALDLRGSASLALDVVGGPGAADPLVRALWRAGAVRVATSWVDVRGPAVADVTVPVGSARTKAAVRVRVARDEDGELLSVRCLAEDVREAARATRRPEEVVRAEALQTWSGHEADRAASAEGSEERDGKDEDGDE